jgi:hypothetical protein
MNQMAKKCINFIDRHPRTGWYNTVILTLLFIITVADKVS